MADILKPVFGEVWASAGEKLSPDTIKIQGGWVQEMMPYQYENFLVNRQDVAITYLLQKGVAEWSSDQEYIANKSVVQYLGHLYIATSTTTNVLPSVTASWRKLTVTVGTNGTIPISVGGTGATTAEQARINLGVGTAGSVDFPVANGLLVKLSDNTLVARTIVGTSGLIEILNADGVGGNPTINVGTNVAKTNADAAWTTTGSIKLPSGTTAEQGVATPGRIRFNLDTNEFYGAYPTGWQVLSKQATAAQTLVIDSADYYTSNNVEGVLEEVGRTLKSAVLTFLTLGDAEDAATMLPDDQVVEVVSEQKRYNVISGTLVFVSNMDQLRIDLKDPSKGSEEVINLRNAAGATPLKVRDALLDVKTTRSFGDLANDTDSTAAILAAAADKTASTTRYELTEGIHRLSQTQQVSSYFQVQGRGDNTVLKLTAGSIKGFAFVPGSGLFDDHPRNGLSGFRIQGDGVFNAPAQNGTTTGLSFAETPGIGNLGYSERMTYELHGVGRHISQSYGHTGIMNHYRANVVGLLLDRVTSFLEIGIYARHNSGAAVRIIGGQNISFIGGAIEGNRGIGIEYISDPAQLYSQLNLNDVYFESNGDEAAGVPSIKYPMDGNTTVSIRGGNLWRNLIAGVASGPYILGSTVSIEGATLNGYFHAKHVTSYRNNRCPTPLPVWNTMSTEAQSRLYDLKEPAIFHNYIANYAPFVPFTSANIGGNIIGTVVRGKSALRIPFVTNLVPTVYPYGMTAASGAVASENSALDYGDGSWVGVQFTPAIGSFNSNYSTLASYPDSTRQYRIYCCLIRPDADCELGFVQSVGGQSIAGYFSFKAGVTYRVMFCAYAPMTAGSFLRMFPLDSSGPKVNVLPLWSSQHSDHFEQLRVMEFVVNGS